MTKSLMLVERRTFIGTLMASVVGTAFEWRPLLWAPAPARDLPLIAPAALVTLEDITREALRRLVARVDSPMTLMPVNHIGDVLRNGFQLHHWGVDLAADLPSIVNQCGFDPDRYLEPAMANLAHQLRKIQPRGCGQLPLPAGCFAVERLTDKASGLSLRGIFDYDWREDGEAVPTLRFDVLVAT